MQDAGGWEIVGRGEGRDVRSRTAGELIEAWQRCETGRQLASSSRV